MATSIHSTSGWEKNPSISQEEFENLPTEFTTNYEVSNAETSYSTYREDWNDPVAKWPPVAGWPMVSSFMAKRPDLASSSRFSDLNVKSLLYYQAQLTSLRKQLHIQEHDDKRGYGYAFNDGEEGKYEGHDEDAARIGAEEVAEGEVFQETRRVEKELKETRREQAKEDAYGARETAKQFARRADFLMGAQGSKQLKLVTEIRKLLKEYSEFLLPT